MDKNYFAILDTETNKFVTADEAVNAGADINSDAVGNIHFKEMFAEDDGELAYIIHDAGKVNDWKVVPVNVDIKITLTPK